MRQAREARNLAPVVHLLRTGHDLTNEEWNQLAALALNVGKVSSADENGDTAHSLMLADAWEHFDKLVAARTLKEKALKLTCEKFPIGVLTLMDVVRGGRKPVRAIRERRQASDSSD